MNKIKNCQNKIWQNQLQKNLYFNIQNLPADSFLHRYIKHFEKITESPNEFLLSAILAGMGALIGNKVFLKTAINRIFPNLWIIILGKTTALRKSTAINLARGLLKYIGWDSFLPQIVHENTLIERLELAPASLMVFDEWKSLHSKISSRKGQSFKAMLTELYDSYEYKKIIKNTGSGKEKYQQNTLKNLSLSLIAASTLDWFQFDKSDILSGFLPRFLFCTICENYKKPIPLPSKNNTKKLGEELKNILQYLKSKQAIALSLSTEAKYLYEQWYYQNYSTAAKAKHPLLPGFYRRMEQYILKFSIILHCSGAEFRSNKISAKSMQAALELGEYYLNNIKFLIQEKLAPSKITTAMQKTLKYMERHEGEVSKRELQRNVRPVRSGEMLERVLTKMQAQSIIEIKEVSTSGRPKKLINFK